MTMTTQAMPLDIAIAFTQAWTGHDVPKAAEYVSEDVVFEGPLAQTTGSAAYLKALMGLARDVTGFKMLAAFGDGDQALLMYDLTTRSYGNLTCAKLITVRNGKIERDKLTFDSHLIRGSKAA
jgi:ketosteroid isomerase-like protein